MENWQLVQDVFFDAMRRTPEERPVFLDRVCREDKTLRREIESLLSSYDRAGSFLEMPAVVGITDVAETRKFEKGRRFGHFEILGEIGAGGMGEVYLAEDASLERKVAVKFLNEEFSDDPEKLKRFIREAKAASALNHPNILTVYEIGETDGMSYIAAEFIEGKTLRERLSNKDPMPLKTILKIGVQVAEAVSAAHQAGIIHRDIKPENIMIREDGYAKVLDFGLAKLVETDPVDLERWNKEVETLMPSPQTKRRLTSPGMVMGTISYLSPEQARGEETDQRTDIWSLGVVLYEMLAGRLPFEGETVKHTIAEILEKEPLLPENVPDELQRIVRRALTKDKALRYRTAQDLLADLKNLRRKLDIQSELGRSLNPDEPQTTGTAGRNAVSIASLEPAFARIKSHKIAAAFIVMIVFGIISAAVYSALLPESPGTRIESVAVMPFINETGDKDAEYLSDGVTETLINSLSNIPNLNVKSRSAVFRYKGKETNFQIIANELNVQVILIGRVSQNGDRLTLSLELINPATETALWGNKYERNASELVTLQTDIARDVSGKLRSKLSNADEQKVIRTYTADPEAYKLYLQGRYFWNKRTGDALKQAAEFFKQALEKDPEYVLAYSGLAETYVLYADYNAGSPEESMPQAKTMALRALELDDTLAQPHAVLGNYLSQYEWDREGAEREYRRAVELSPNSATAHQWLGYHLATRKRFDEAFAELRRAEELDPLSLITKTNIGDTFLFARRYDEAIAQYRSVLSLDPNFLYARINLGWAYDLKGMHREAIAEFRTAADVYYEPLIKAYIAIAQEKSGQHAEAVKLLKELKAESESNQIYVPEIAIAMVYVALGQNEEAFTWMEKDIARHSPYTTYYAVIPEFDDLRPDPRFGDILKRLNLPE